ncbi:hypothetical protein [Synechococcus sp. CB0205]|uniref:hypothetical protein n=1 Tax=Synechococcus sp. CB0205 TaxID=232363 RepID=UPI0002002B51|nr:hypothetical protein [Synechococcus sp. CB0205]
MTEDSGGSGQECHLWGLMNEYMMRTIDSASHREKQRQIDAVEFAIAMHGRKSWTTAHDQTVFAYLKKHPR